MLEHSKIFQSRDIECIITPYMPFYLASQRKINNITIQHLYTNWLNSLIIKLYHDKVFVIFSKSFCLQKTPESRRLCTSLCSNNLSLPHKLKYHSFPSPHFDHDVSLSLPRLSYQSSLKCKSLKEPHHPKSLHFTD